MRLPQAFRPEKKVNIENFVETSEEKRIDRMLSNYEDFKERVKEISNHIHSWKYKLCKEVIIEISYNKKDLERLSREMKITKEDGYLGLYLSSLTNKIIKEKDTITLRLNGKLDCLGSYLKKGKLVIEFKESNVRQAVNIGKLHSLDYWSMPEGPRKISEKKVEKKNNNNLLGFHMAGGTIFVKGNVGKELGFNMTGGEIHVNGKIEHIDPDCKGKIYHRGELIWPK